MQVHGLSNGSSSFSAISGEPHFLPSTSWIDQFSSGCGGGGEGEGGGGGGEGDGGGGGGEGEGGGGDEVWSLLLPPLKPGSMDRPVRGTNLVSSVASSLLQHGGCGHGPRGGQGHKGLVNQQVHRSQPGSSHSGGGGEEGGGEGER